MKERLILTFDYLPCLNYSMSANGVACCNTFVMENNDDKDWHQILVTLSGEFIDTYTAHVDSL